MRPGQISLMCWLASTLALAAGCSSANTHRTADLAGQEDDVPQAPKVSPSPRRVEADAAAPVTSLRLPDAASPAAAAPALDGDATASPHAKATPGDAGATVSAEWPTSSPISIRLINTMGSPFMSLTHKENPNNKIGHRFFENDPLRSGPVPKSNAEAGIDPEEVKALEEKFTGHPGVTTIKFVPTKRTPRQDWRIHLVPVTDGVEILQLVQTFDQGMPAYHAEQQCFRMSGARQNNWRNDIARAPDFSEYDLWATTPGNRSLSWALRDDKWALTPGGTSRVRIHTKYGQEIARRYGSVGMSGNHPAIDDGLFTRLSRQGDWISGIYWENTALVTNHHPADCLHHFVNIGNIPANSRRAIRAKLFWFKGDLEALRRRFAAWHSGLSEP
jgi:hypothetical protein